MEEILAGMSLTILHCNSVEPLRKHGFRILLLATSSNSKFSREYPKVHDQDLNIWSLHQRVCSDSREIVTARCLVNQSSICPAKREFMEFGCFKQPGTFLPKAPKGRGWLTALLFDELGDILQDGTLRVVAVVQLV